MNRRMFGTAILSVFLFAALALSGCSSAAVYQMDSGDRTAGAEGEATVNKDRNGNQVVTLKVAHLPLPSRLDQAMGTYVVWVSPAESNTTYNMGQIRLTNDRTGEITFTTPFPAFQMVVTAEVDGTAMAPSNQVVLRRGVGVR
jgi:PBP1b-binding outer membrane lipoprotein LpoB